MTPRSRYGLHRLVIATAMLAGITTGCTSASTPTSTNTSSRTSLPAGARTQTWLAYQAPQGADDRVFLVRDDGSDAHAIADALPGRTGHPDFSRDGHHLVIDQLTDEGGVDQVYVSDQDGKDPRLIARCRPPACLGQWEPAWSPDGHRLAVSIGVGPMTDHGQPRTGSPPSTSRPSE